MIRVAIFNDSKTLRARLRLLIEKDPDFQVVLEAEDGRLAGQRVRESGAGLVLMDVVMPHVDGYQATRNIIQHHPVPIVIVTAALNPNDSAVIFSALAAGALYVTSPPGDERHSAGFMQLLRASASAIARTSEPPQTPPPPAPDQPPPPSQLSVIAFAASAGGPQALTEILHGLPPKVLPPILIVQHLAADFERSFADWLTSTTQHRVLLAEHGTRAMPGIVYLAAPGKHLVWDTGHLALSDDPPVKRFRPSATVLLQSLVPEAKRALAVVLSGMGTDGAEGARALRDAGGHVVIQSRESAAIWGMPGETLRLQGADVELPASEIAQHIVSKSGRSEPAE